MFRTPYADPHHMKVVKHFNLFDIDVEPILIGSTSSIMVHCYHLLLGSYHAFFVTSKERLVKESSRNVIRTHPIAYPHPMKFAKDLICV